MIQVRWRKYRKGRLNVVQGMLLRAVLMVGAVSMLVPFAWMVSTALKDKHTMENEPQRWVPRRPLVIDNPTWAVDYIRATTADFEDVVLNDFEQPDSGERLEPGRHGAGSLVLEADFAHQPDLARSVRFPAGLPDKPVGMLCFWLRGDRSGHALRVSVRGEGFTYNSTKDLLIQFEGWKEVSCFFRPEKFDPLGREIIQMGCDDPNRTGHVNLADLHSIDFVVLPRSPAARAWQHWTYSFRKAWASMPFGRFYLNSLFIALAVTFGQVLTSSLAAYAFARLNFPGRDKLFFAYLATMMVPVAVTIVPTFILMKLLGWFDTYRALICPTLFSAYGTFLLRQFFKSLPVDLEDAARIDGCGKLRVWLHVMMPLSKPALATLATFTFLGSWASFQWPLFATQSMHMKVLPIGLSAFQDKFSVEYNLLMAASLIVMVPTLLVFLFNQRFFTRGIQLSGMKQ